MNTAATAVVLLNWNGWRDTIGCIESLLLMQSASDMTILVCDNESTDDSVEQLRLWASRRFGNMPERWLDLTRHEPEAGVFRLAGKVALIQNSRNGGFAAGNNVGLRLALAEHFDYFWILNNDTEVDRLALSALISRMQEDPTIGICGAKLVYAECRDRVQAWGGAHFIRLKGRGVQLGAFASIEEEADIRAVENAMSYVIGASMFVSREFLETVGLMTEDYFLYWEEIDWACRAAGRFRLGYAPDAIVYHKVGGSIGTKDGEASSALADYYLTRNRIKFCFRYSKISLPFVLFDTTRTVLRWAGRRNMYRAASMGRAILGLPFVAARAS